MSVSVDVVKRVVTSRGAILTHQSFDQPQDNAMCNSRKIFIFISKTLNLSLLFHRFIERKGESERSQTPKGLIM
ncbi:hypothetical protein Syun_012209 [Stephania yunnanensis]|uniref:Uncharacterized protein n=1 Tax=Stephania yunnanensis TaxID=152371 RepID=A0AAP0PHB0_9MAGN